uniref:Carboxylic ester hydrolase n=1 Tax=Macrostomum lignano TaxID=282301 RepID=A0A1I8H0Q2_9PLAT
MLRIGLLPQWLLVAAMSAVLLQPMGSEAQAAAPRHTVNLTNGSSIQGFTSTVRSRTVWSYLGIPYAKPPVGALRFKPSVPLDSPIGNSSLPYDASKKPKACYYWPLSPQEFEKTNPALMMWWNNTEMSEDCLYLNVWSPTSDSAAGKAVMVWIYGGGFFGGSSSLKVYDGAVLAATGDVVVASMQYRTGALGFMFLDDTEAPGNAGLYDQYRAIQWIHENIRAFGGDNSQITLFGESAGAVSVSYHLLSPYTQGYFRRAILNSGSAIAWWASESRSTGWSKSLALADLAKCRPGNTRDGIRIANCLRQVTPELLQQQTWNAMSDNLRRYQESGNSAAIANPETALFFDVPFKPVFGSDFLPKMPAEQLRDSKMNNDVKKADLLLGVVKDEGAFWIMYALGGIFMHNNGNWNIPFWWGQPLDQQLNRDYDFLVQNRTGLDMDKDPYNLVARYFIVNNTHLDSLVTEAVSFEYQVPSKLFGRTSWTAKETLDALDDLTSDRSFKCPTVDFAEMYAQMLGTNGSNSIWMYSFEQRSQMLPLPEWTGVMHGYELDYVFGTPFNQRFGTILQQSQLSDDVMKFWTNFARTGNPNQFNSSSLSGEAWPAYNLSDRSYIVLKSRPSTASSFRIGQNLRKRQCDFLRYQVPNIVRQIGARYDCSSDRRSEPTMGPASSANALQGKLAFIILVAGLVQLSLL